MPRFEARELLRPEIAVPAVYLLFLALAALSFRIDVTKIFLIGSKGHFSPPTAASYGISLVGIAGLYLTARYVGKTNGGLDSPIVLLALPPLILATLTLAQLYPLLIRIAMSLGFPLALYLLASRARDLGALAMLSFVAALLPAALILASGVPIFNAASRGAAAVDPYRAFFHGFAVFSGCLFAVQGGGKLALTGIATLASLGLLSGFKSDAVAVLISSAVAGVLVGRLRFREVAYALAAAMAILTLVSTFIAKASYQGWAIPPIYYIIYRPGFTFAVFNEIVKIAYPLGALGGSALLDPTQRIVSMAVLSKVYSEPRIITSTMLGPGMLDFGVLGALLTALLIGAYLGFMHRVRSGRFGDCLYAIALTHAMILVEVGLQLTSTVFLLSLLYLALAGREK